MRWRPHSTCKPIEMYAICNSSWGELMHRLKDYVEGRNPGPHWKEQLMNERRSDLIVVALAKAKPGKEEDLEQALRAVASPTRAQPGSIAFSLYRSAHDSTTLIAFERWASRKDHDRRLQGTHERMLMS